MKLEVIKPYLPWITLLVLVLVVGIANPAFFDPAGMIALVADVVPLFIMALGMTFAIYIGGIDLSMQQKHLQRSCEKSRSIFRLEYVAYCYCVSRSKPFQRGKAPYHNRVQPV